MSEVVSVILNVHNEAEYLDRTCQTLLEAVCFGRSAGLSFELIVVLDKATQDVQDWCRRYDFERIAPARFIEIADGSLALARQAGLEACTGEYVSTADADDLISFNYFAAACSVLTNADPRTAVSQEFIYAFGATHHQWQYFPSSRLTRMMAFYMNPYTSRISARRRFMLEMGYVHPRREMGEAYEDWDLNSRILASKGNFQIAPDTVLFYRQRRNGIMGSIAGTERLPRKSSYHAPDQFLRFCQIDYERYVSGRVPWPPDPAQIRRDVRRRPQIRQVVAAANQIDAGVRIDQLEFAPTGSNLHGNIGWGAAYYEACQKVVGRAFSDVVLMPYIIHGGGEKYIFGLLNALRSLDSARTFLILGGEPMEADQALDLLPDGATYVNLHDICRKYAPEALDAVTLRLIQACEQPVTLHLKASPYAHQFFKRFGGMLGDGVRPVYYYFTDPWVRHEGFVFNQGNSFEFISDNHKNISKIVSDHRGILNGLISRIPIGEKCVTMPAFCELSPERGSAQRKGPFSLLWASRLDPQKRPDILPAITRELSRRNFDFRFDVYGATSPNYHVAANLSDGPMSYKGPFKAFGDIPAGRYDVLIYTAYHDGLPNVVLEAMASGLPVIAPRIGGIPEAVDDTRGLIIDADCEEEELAVRYADAVIAMSRMDRSQLGRNGREFVRRQHSFEGLVRAVKAAGI